MKTTQKAVQQMLSKPLIVLKRPERHVQISPLEIPTQLTGVCQFSYKGRKTSPLFQLKYPKLMLVIKNNNFVMIIFLFSKGAQ